MRERRITSIDMLQPEAAPTGSAHGYTPRELARMLRVGPDRIRAWIQSGELGAINTAPTRSGRPRYVILPEHLRQWAQARRAGPPAQPVPRRRRRTGAVDYYPD